MSRKRRVKAQAEDDAVDEDFDVPAPRARRTTTRKTYVEEEEDDADDLMSTHSGSEPSETDGGAAEVIQGNQLSVDKILGRKMVATEGAPADQKQEMFLVKWKGLSYLHVSWETLEDICNVDHNGAQRVKRFFASPAYALQQELEREDGDNDHIEYFDPDYVEVQRIISCETPDCHHSEASTLEELEQIIQNEEHKTREAEDRGGENENEDVVIRYLVKWAGLPYNECTWEAWADIQAEAKQQVLEFWQRENAPAEVNHGNNHPSLPQYQKLTESPAYAGGGLRLREYQLEGVNWLVWNWWHKRPCILADEMGLGKTIQAVSFIQQLRNMEATQLVGPFLVVAPLSLLNQWQNEVMLWASSMNTVVYHGSSEAREVIQQHEFWYQEPYVNRTQATTLRKHGVTKFNILLTTYDVVIKDSKTLSKIPWKVLIVDEAHRLKNNTSRLFEELITIPYDHCVLLTGTPLQNKTEELWSLLHFADKQKFKDRQEFLARFGNLRDSKQVAQLHNTLKPYLLRRVKEDVEKSLPPKEETIVEVALTAQQKQFYRAIYEKNTSFLFKGAKPSNAPSLMNVMMELRKCCNHPYLVRGVEERIISEIPAEERTEVKLHEQMIESAGKMVLLDKLLPRLHAEGHKVLIFSQMVRVLDLLEDFLRFRNYAYERLDGSARAVDRNASVDRFNDPAYNRYVMLLSTRAGGLGLNLTSADTVIIYDSDWNPQNDIQAQARAHRIGQTRAVMVYRLLTAKTYEMHMFHKASLKLGLDRAVLAHARHADAAADGPRFKEVNKPDVQAREIDELLKRGAYDIFREDDQEQKEFVEADIDSIMKRSAHKITYGASGPTGAPSLSSFSKASFVSTDQTEDVDINDPDFWKKAVGLEDNARTSETIFAEDLPQQRRRRQTTMYDMETRSEEGEFVDGADLDDLVGLDADFPGGESAKAPKEKRERDRSTPKSREPKDWGSHSRDRLVRALLLYGFNRWSRIQRESGSHARNVREVEMFARACIMQWGLCASEGDQPKNESAFVQEAISAAKKLKQRMEADPSVFSMPSVLEDDKFLAKQRSGGARKALTRLDMLAKLTQIMTEALQSCEKHSITRRQALVAKENEKAQSGEAAEPAEAGPEEPAPPTAGKKRGRSSAGSATAAPTPPREPDIDDYLQRYAPQDIASRLPLGDFRPPWTKIAPWWDDKCDRHLLVGIFKHGFGRYSDLRNDSELCFHEKIREFMASNSKTSQVVGDSSYRVHITLESGQEVIVELPAMRHSQYKGVYAQPGSTRWLAQYGDAESNTYIETRDTQLEAALEYDKEARKKEGSAAICNFDEDGNRIETTVSDGTSLPLPWHRASKYRGVRASGAKWTAQISYATLNHHLGTFTTELEAAIAYDTAAKEHHGPGASLNFAGGMEKLVHSLLEEEGVTVEFLGADGSVERTVDGGPDYVAADQPSVPMTVDTSVPPPTSARSTPVPEDADGPEPGDEEKGSPDNVNMPDARTLNKLIGWLLSTPEARMSQRDLEKKQREGKKHREGGTVAERREAKLRAAADEEKKNIEKLGEQALLLQLSHLLDPDAINAAHRMSALRKLEKYLRSNKSNDEPDEHNIDHSMIEVASAENGRAKDETDAENKAETAGELSEDEVVRVVAVLVLHGAPISESEDVVPLSCLGSIGFPSDSSSGTLPLYSWQDVLSMSGVNRSVQELEHFYLEHFLPFCGAICKTTKQLSPTSRVIFPQPYRRIHEHNIAAKGLCCIFLQRQQQFRAMRFQVARRFDMILQYLRSPSGRDVQRVPQWWCPWIHDAAMLIGCLKHGYLALPQICSDPTLPLTVSEVKQHTYRTFLLGSSDTLPAAFTVLNDESQAEQWLDAVSHLFPDKSELESRIARLLVEMTKSLPNGHPMRIRQLWNVTDDPEDGELGTDAFAPTAHDETMLKRPARPLSRFLWETAKRRRVAFAYESLNGSTEF